MDIIKQFLIAKKILDDDDKPFYMALADKAKAWASTDKGCLEVEKVEHLKKIADSEARVAEIELTINSK